MNSLEDPLVWWNGRYERMTRVRIHPLDRGFQFGDGVFETIRVQKGRPIFLQDHLERLTLSLKALGFALRHEYFPWVNEGDERVETKSVEEIINHLIEVNSLIDFNAIGYDEYNNTIEITPVWNSTAGDINESGILNATNIGIHNVTAEFTGPLQTADLTLNSSSTPPLSYSGPDPLGFNLIGNPFVSALDWDIGTWNETDMAGTVLAEISPSFT